MEKEKILIAENIVRTYSSGGQKVNAIKGINLTVMKGEIVIIVGRSGSGKTTFLNVLGGLLTPDSGNVLIRGKSLYKLSEKERAAIRNKEYGFVFQNFNLINELSVLNNIRLPYDIASKYYDIELERKVLKMLGLEKRVKFYPEQLSGGEKQRVAIARSLLMNPKIILADEPTGNLDPDTAWDIMQLLDEINRRGTTVIMATHAKSFVNILRKRVVTLSDGRIIGDVQKGRYGYIV